MAFNIAEQMILVTGSAGFIGFHLVEYLLNKGESVVGIDNLNDYYDPGLKKARLAAASAYDFHEVSLEDADAIDALFARYAFTKVCNLAAQAGVRYSLTNPQAYINSNVTGFVNILEACRKHSVEHLVYASSSSVYGLNDQVPFKETDAVEQPASLYAATKRSNELLAHVYAHLYGLPATGLRFFTVYGSWGRPDMAYSLFADAMLNGRPIKVFNHGEMSRDFTSVTDIVEGIARVILQPRPPKDGVPARVYNIGAGKPMRLLDFIRELERQFGIEAEKEFVGMQPGDVTQTYADTQALERDYGYRATTELREGIQEFVSWYRRYHGYKVEERG